MTCFVANASVVYSVTVKDRATVDCRLLLSTTGHILAAIILHMLSTLCACHLSNLRLHKSRSPVTCVDVPLRQFRTRTAHASAFHVENSGSARVSTK
ncbi:hypothetical protein Plhal304r1_c028g0092941 [Plasmopara halstedii]